MRTSILTKKRIKGETRKHHDHERRFHDSFKDHEITWKSSTMLCMETLLASTAHNSEITGEFISGTREIQAFIFIDKSSRTNEVSFEIHRITGKFKMKARINLEGNHSMHGKSKEPLTELHITTTIVDSKKITRANPAILEKHLEIIPRKDGAWNKTQFARAITEIHEDTAIDRTNTIRYTWFSNKDAFQWTYSRESIQLQDSSRNHKFRRECSRQNLTYSSLSRDDREPCHWNKKNHTTFGHWRIRICNSTRPPVLSSYWSKKIDLDITTDYRAQYEDTRYSRYPARVNTGTIQLWPLLRLDQYAIFIRFIQVLKKPPRQLEGLKPAQDIRSFLFPFFMYFSEKIIRFFFFFYFSFHVYFLFPYLGKNPRSLKTTTDEQFISFFAAL